MILVVGHPRCGTGYMAKLFQAFGLDVQHERMGRDGTSCWAWSAVSQGPHSPDELHPGFCEGHYVMVHVLRDPRKALWSIAYGYDCGKTRSHMDRFRLQMPGWSELDNAALSYVSWNRMIEAQAPDLTVQVERAPVIIADWLDKELPHSLPPTDYNTRQKRNKATPPDDCLSQLRPETLEIVTKYAARYYPELESAEAMSA